MYLNKKTIIRLWLATVLLLMACGPAAKEATPTPMTEPTPIGAKEPTPTVAPTPTPLATPAPATTAPRTGGVVGVSQREDPPTWDPARTTAAPTIFTGALVFSRLFTLWTDPPGLCKSELNPVLVKQWRWVDDQTAEFTLKEDVRFQNRPPVTGRELVAQDVAFSLEK